MTEAEKLRHCIGCHNDFYNDKNPLGVKRCWHLVTAHMVSKKEVHIDQVPPWDQNASQFLSCFQRDHHIYVEPSRTN